MSNAKNYHKKLQMQDLSLAAEFDELADEIVRTKIFKRILSAINAGAVRIERLQQVENTLESAVEIIKHIVYTGPCALGQEDNKICWGCGEPVINTSRGPVLGHLENCPYAKAERFLNPID